MIAGLPPESWVLIVAAVGAGLLIELLFYRAHRADTHEVNDAAREDEVAP